MWVRKILRSCTNRGAFSREGVYAVDLGAWQVEMELQRYNPLPKGQVTGLVHGSRSAASGGARCTRNVRSACMQTLFLNEIHELEVNAHSLTRRKFTESAVVASALRSVAHRDHS